MNTLPDKFDVVYKEYWQLHPDAQQSGELTYLSRQWFFSNHIDVMLDLVQEFHKRYFPTADLSVALFAALLHDAGLVYKRTDKSPVGHENRSCEYATLILQKHGFNETFITAVCEAIAATEPEVEPTTDEASLVRNADAYSHLSTMHFIAKAYFAHDLVWYINWFQKKIHMSLEKLTISELIEEKKPIVENYEKMLAMYEKYKDKHFIDVA